MTNSRKTFMGPLRGLKFFSVPCLYNSDYIEPRVNYLRDFRHRTWSQPIKSVTCTKRSCRKKKKGCKCRIAAWYPDSDIITEAFTGNEQRPIVDPALFESFRTTDYNMVYEFGFDKHSRRSLHIEVIFLGIIEGYGNVTVGEEGWLANEGKLVCIIGAPAIQRYELNIDQLGAATRAVRDLPGWEDIYIRAVDKVWSPTELFNAGPPCNVTKSPFGKLIAIPPSEI